MVTIFPYVPGAEYSQLTWRFFSCKGAVILKIECLYSNLVWHCSKPSKVRRWKSITFKFSVSIGAYYGNLFSVPGMLFISFLSCNYWKYCGSNNSSRHTLSRNYHSTLNYPFIYVWPNLSSPPVNLMQETGCTCNRYLCGFHIVSTLFKICGFLCFVLRSLLAKACLTTSVLNIAGNN